MERWGQRASLMVLRLRSYFHAASLLQWTVSLMQCRASSRAALSLLGRAGTSTDDETDRADVGCPLSPLSPPLGSSPGGHHSACTPETTFTLRAGEQLHTHPTCPPSCSHYVTPLPLNR